MFRWSEFKTGGDSFLEELAGEVRDAALDCGKVDQVQIDTDGK